MSRAKPEHAEQVALIRTVSAWTKQYPALSLLFAIPNGGDRNPRVGANLKREGVRRGVPDLCLPVVMRDPETYEITFNALFIEMKAANGKASREQIEWARALMNEGNAVAFCWSAADAFKVLLDYVNRRYQQKPEPWKRPRPGTLTISRVEDE